MVIKRWFLTGMVALTFVIPGACASGVTESPISEVPRQIWSVRYDGPDHLDDTPKALAVDAKGNAHVTGISSGGTETYEDFITIKYDTNGNQLWTARFDGPEHRNDMPQALALDNYGNVYVTGWSYSIETDYDYVTIKYDPDGNELWVARYNGEGNGEDIANDIAVDKSGNVYITGGSTGTDGFGRATIKYDTYGNQQWVAYYKVPGESRDGANALALDSQGNIYVTGPGGGTLSGGTGSGLPGTTTPPGTPNDILTIKYDNDGDELWATTYDGPAKDNDVPHGLKVDGDGNVYIAGESMGDGTGYDSVAIKYHTSGSQLWVSRYNSPENSSDGATDLALDPDGNVYITGYSYGTEERDYLTIKYDSDGNELWTALYGGIAPGDDIARSIAVDDIGKVYVTGESGFDYHNTGAYEDIATVKYNTDGNEVWVGRYSHHEGTRDKAVAIVLYEAEILYIVELSTEEASANYDIVISEYVGIVIVDCELENHLP